MQVVHITDLETTDFTLESIMYLLPISLWTTAQTAAYLPEFVMAYVFGIVTCAQSKHGGHEFSWTCLEIYSILFVAAATILLNIMTIISCFTSHERMIKDLLLFKMVEDSLLAIFTGPLTKFFGVEKYAIPLFIWLTSSAVYELYWSVSLGDFIYQKDLELNF